MMQPTPEQQADFERRVAAFVPELRALLAKHQLVLSGGYGPYGESVGVEAPIRAPLTLCASLGETIKPA